MTTDPAALAARLEAAFATRIANVAIAFDEVTLTIAATSLEAVARALRDQPEFAFEQLVDLCGLDLSTFGTADWKTERATSTGFSRGVTRSPDGDDAPATARFCVVVHLLSLRQNQRLRLRVPAPGEPPTVPSLTGIWPSADWYEREAFDLFGILFEGHPDLRRLLTDYGFVGHPFRKDFPLEGNVEVRYDPERRRVVYQPVTIDARVLVPRVIRHDHRYLVDAPAGESGRA